MSHDGQESMDVSMLSQLVVHSSIARYVVHNGQTKQYCFFVYLRKHIITHDWWPYNGMTIMPSNEQLLPCHKLQ